MVPLQAESDKGLTEYNSSRYFENTSVETQHNVTIFRVISRYNGFNLLNENLHARTWRWNY